MSRKFEYKVDFAPGSQYLEKWLNRMGKQGWRVISTAIKGVNDDDLVILFEREIDRP